VTLAAVVHVTVVLSTVTQPFSAQLRPVDERPAVSSLFNDALYRMGPAADLFAVYRAGVRAREGRSPFAGDRLAGDPPFAYPYRYLPMVAQTLGRALAALSPRTAYLLWVACIETALIAFLAVFVGRVRDPFLRWSACLVLLLSSPHFLEVHMGQFTFATTALVGIALLLFESARIRAGAALLAAGFALKAFSLITLPALLREKAPRAAALGAAGLIVAVSLIYFAAAPEDWTQFRTVNLTRLDPGPQTGNFGLLYTVTIALHECGLQWSPDGFAVFARAWQIVLVGVAVVLAFRASPRAMTLGAATLLVAYFLAYHHVWEHHYSACVLLGLVILRGCSEAESAHHRAWKATAWAALVLVAAPTPFILFDNGDLTWASWPSYQRWLLPLTKSGPLLVLFVAGLRQLWACPMNQVARPAATRVSTSGCPGRGRRGSR
jgi:hypothetical protein